MRTVLGLAALACGFVCAVSSPAAADCQPTPVRYHFQDEVLLARVLVRGDRTCHHYYRASGTARFIDFAITERPHHGTLVRSSVASAVYTASAGYKGEDTYALRICGRARCSTVRYLATIE